MGSAAQLLAAALLAPGAQGPHALPAYLHPRGVWMAYWPYITRPICIMGSTLDPLWIYSGSILDLLDQQSWSGDGLVLSGPCVTVL